MRHRLADHRPVGRVSLRTVVLDVPPQDIITRDNVSVKVNAVVYFRVLEPIKAVIEVENYLYATSQLAQTTLRSVLGQADLDELLSAREQLNEQAAGDHRRPDRSLGDQGVDGGAQARRPADRDAAGDGASGRGRAREARQDHPRRGRVRGVQAARRGRRRDVAEPDHDQLRYLQTLPEIGAEKNSTIVFPMPIDLLRGLIPKE